MPPKRGLNASGKLKKKKAKSGASDEAPVVRPEALPSPVNAALLSAESRQALGEEFRTAQPYTHVVLRDLCDEGRMRAMIDEIIETMVKDGLFTKKETDIFKVLQSPDLANLDFDTNPALAVRLPQLLSLRSAIYSKEFRQMVQDITGCGELCDRVDLSANVYTHGSHLLCHDDVIGTRCVSFIIYLPDADDTWTAEDGGALELYPCPTLGNPDPTPTKNLLPLFNTMAMFTVQPGVSFHSVQEVYQVCLCPPPPPLSPPPPPLSSSSSLFALN
jgi:Rps23 Pro-64 3,4-dihydroxylase Tpa1-like proline 4-hydroxylase